MTVTVVVDACVAIKWFISEPDSVQAQRLFTASYQRAAPDFVLLELANALWKNERLGRVKAEHARSAIAKVPDFFSSLLPSANLLPKAAELAREIDNPVYDCLYVIAASGLNAQLVTTDSKLIVKLAATKHAKNVIELSAWTP